MSESLSDHIKRRAAVIAERVELELTVAGTEYAPLERAIFKATKNNTKCPKEKHIRYLQGAIVDGEYGKSVLKMLVRRVKEVGTERISSGSLAAGIKTLSVWHRLINVGDKGFLSLAAQYSHLVEAPQGNAMAGMYATYLRSLLEVYKKTKRLFHRDADKGESVLKDGMDVDLVVVIVPMLMDQMKALLRCDLQGGLMDGKTRNSCHYAINMLILDSLGLFNQIDCAMDRIRGAIGTLEPENAQAMAKLYEKYSKLPNHMENLVKQVCFDQEACPPSSKLEPRPMRDLKAFIDEVWKKVKSDDCTPDAVKAIADVAVSVGSAAATFTLDEIEADQANSGAKNDGGGDLISLNTPTGANQEAAAPVKGGAAWDPFADDAPASQAPQKAAGGGAWDPFGSTAGDTANPFSSGVQKMEPANSAAPPQGTKKPLTGNDISNLFLTAPVQMTPAQQQQQLQQQGFGGGGMMNSGAMGMGGMGMQGGAMTMGGIGMQGGGMMMGGGGGGMAATMGGYGGGMGMGMGNNNHNNQGMMGSNGFNNMGGMGGTVAGGDLLTGMSNMNVGSSMSTMGGNGMGGGMGLGANNKGSAAGMGGNKGFTATIGPANAKPPEDPFASTNPFA